MRLRFLSEAKKQTRKIPKKFILSLAVFSVAALTIVGLTQRVLADTITTDFEGFTLGDVNGQNGWTSGHGSSTCPLYDVAVVSNTLDYSSFGGQSLRISNAITCGSFNDQTFSKSLANEAGETSADTSVYSGGTRQPYFEAQWDFASTVPGSYQPNLSVVASPDRGDTARMSWLQMQDTPTGLQLNFEDYQHSILDFVSTPIATGLDRTVPHTVKITMQFVDGPSNDIVKVYVDGALAHIGTSWEDYFRDVEGGVTHSVDSMLFRVSNGSLTGLTNPALSGNGFLIDNFSSFSGPVPVTPAPSDVYVNSTWGSVPAGQDPDGSGPASQMGYDAFTTIQAGINAVALGGTVNVAAGIYNESLLISRPLTLQSISGSGLTFIDASITGNPYVIFISANNVTLNGFDISSPGYTGGADASGVVVEPSPYVSDSHIHITSNVIHDIGSPARTSVAFGNVGINIGAAEGVEIDHNIIYNIIHNDPTAWANGISIWGGDSSTPSGNIIIHDNSFHDISSPYLVNAAISTQTDVGPVTVYNNSIVSTPSNPTEYGVEVRSTNTVDASNNYWGSADPDFTSIIKQGQGSVAYTAWCTDATCANLFSDSTVNLSAIGGVAMTSSAGPMTLTGPTSSGNVTATIPAGTTITDSTGLWNGTLDPPAVSSYSVPGAINTALAFSIGSNDFTLTFNQGVRLFLPGQAGKHVGFIEPGGNFTEITTVCSDDTQAIGDSLPPLDGACKINVGGNLIIWTKHFTIFAAYTIAVQVPTKSNTYVIQPGDTMSAIAGKFGLTLAQLESLNPQAGHPAGNFDLILPGDVLNVGGAVVTTKAAAAGTVPGPSSAGQASSTSTTSSASPLSGNGSVKAAEVGTTGAKATGLKWYWWLTIATAVLAVGGLGAYNYKAGKAAKK